MMTMKTRTRMMMSRALQTSLLPIHRMITAPASATRTHAMGSGQTDRS